MHTRTHAYLVSCIPHGIEEVALELVRRDVEHLVLLEHVADVLDHLRGWDLDLVVLQLVTAYVHARVLVETQLGNHARGNLRQRGSERKRTGNEMRPCARAADSM